VSDDGRRLRVGVVGLGDIARKAYLPVLATRADLDLLLCTRNAEVLDAVGDQWRIAERHTDVAQLTGAGLDAVFVHVATAAHLDVAALFLAARVPTFVDKPLAYGLGEATALVDLARENHTSLFVGFNRRYAPVYRELGRPAPTFVAMQKNRSGPPDDPRRVVFDDFVHVVDTLRFLVPGADLAAVRHVSRGGLLELVTIQLAGDDVTAVGSMNRAAGHTHEVLDVQTRGRRRVVLEMATVHDYRDGRHLVTERGDWTPVAEQRGFGAMCSQFLDGVRAGVVFDASDALRTHEMCERIVAAVAG
jgi:virulence factor